MATPDCFFVVDGNEVAEKDRRVHCLCIPCVYKEKIENAWFWEGSKFGYSKYLHACEKCGQVIYDPEAHDTKTS